MRPRRPRCFPDPSARPLLLAALLVGLPILVHQGCGGIEHIPVNPYLPLDENLGQVGDQTSQSEVLALSAVQPRELRIGDTLVIHGAGRTFPAGFARFTFSGSATAEVELPRPVGEIRVKVPPGTISGPFGFLITYRSVNFDIGGGNNATGEATPAFRIPSPGIRILGAAEPPGGFPNSPYPQGPPVQPIPGPLLDGFP